MQRFLLWGVRLYQQRFSGLKRQTGCRFVPTCSQYAYEAIEKFGALKGSGLAIWRLLRCHPFCKGGYDPIP